MSDFGLTPKGFKRKQYTDIVSEMEMRARELFGENINLSERTPLGIIIRLMAWFLSVAWMLAEKVYYSAYPDTAEGVSLDRLGPFASIRRRRAEHAVGMIKVTGEPFYEQEAGFLISTPNGVVFETTASFTLDASGQALVPIRAVDTGAAGNVDADTITEIINPNPSIESVTNPEPTEGGRARETDAEFRERFFVSTEGRGASTIAAIRSRLLQVPGVRAATVVENFTMNVVDGRPPKSIECYVLGGESVDVAQSILETKAAGIETHGQESEIVKDISGQEHTIKFTRANEVMIHIRAELTTDNRYPSDGDEMLKTAFLQTIGGEDQDGTRHIGLSMGERVVYARLISVAYRIPGIQDIDLEISTDGTTWVRQNIDIGVDEVAQTSYANIEVQHV